MTKACVSNIHGMGKVIDPPGAVDEKGPCFKKKSIGWGKSDASFSGAVIVMNPKNDNKRSWVLLLASSYGVISVVVQSKGI